ncbi:MAG: DNA-3-methyladenine glycosylase [Pirellulaceae bacterium]
MTSLRVRHAALQHLRSRDPVLRQLVDEVGPFTLRIERDRFLALVRSIISQQISTGAARAIRLRLEQLAAPARICPESLVALEPVALRSAGLSPQKVTYVLDLARKSLNGTVSLRAMGRCSDEVVIERLTQVRGIGRWTAQMFLIFSLGRLDVFPEDDLGVRSAIRNLYGLDELPDKATSRTIAEAWRPYASVASWYCWRSLDLARKKGSAG